MCKLAEVEIAFCGFLCCNINRLHRAGRQMVSVFLDHGADPNMKDINGETGKKHHALFWRPTRLSPRVFLFGSVILCACWYGHLHLISFLSLVTVRHVLWMIQCPHHEWRKSEDSILVIRIILVIRMKVKLSLKYKRWYKLGRLPFPSLNSQYQPLWHYPQRAQSWETKISSVIVITEQIPILKTPTEKQKYIMQYS